MYYELGWLDICLYEKDLNWPANRSQKYGDRLAYSLPNNMQEQEVIFYKGIKNGMILTNSVAM